MPFTRGHLYFALAFVLVFALSMLILYLKDRKLHKTYYRGSFWVILAIVAVLLLLFWLKNLALGR